MHTLFNIKTVVIPRNQYQPDGFSPRVGIGWGMITILIWKKACINLFITSGRLSSLRRYQSLKIWCVCVCVKLILFFLVHVEICDEWEQDKSPPRTNPPPLRQKAPHNEIIIESYYIFLYWCWYLRYLKNQNSLLLKKEEWGN
jgi:hypothetical protein